MTPKQSALQGIQALPDDCTWDDVVREIRGRATWAARAAQRHEPLIAREVGPGWAVEQQAATNLQEGVMSRTYDVVVERDEEGYFVASVPGLRGCHTQASTLEVLLERVREAIELCLEVSGTGGAQFIGIRRVTVTA